MPFVGPVAAVEAASEREQHYRTGSCGFRRCGLVFVEPECPAAFFGEGYGLLDYWSQAVVRRLSEDGEAEQHCRKYNR